MICTIFYAANTFDPEVLFFLAAYVGWIFLRGGRGGGSEGYGSLIDFHIGWFFVCVCGFGSALWSERVFFDAADENCASPELAT